MTRINTNVASLRGLRNLNRANDLLNTSLTRLSTGLQINSGKDNPSGLIASETLRSQVSTIEQSIKNSTRANNVISTADSSLGEISGLLNQVRSLVQEGINSGALSQSEIEANQSQIDAALSAINRISANTTFAGDKLIDGSKAFRTTLTSADNGKLSGFQVNGAVFAGSATIVVDATITTAATKAQLFHTSTEGGLATKTTVEVAGAKGTDVIFLGKGSTLTNIESAVDALTDTTGVQATQTAAVQGAKSFSSATTLADFQVFDKRGATGDTAVFAQALKIVFVDPSGNNQTLSVSSASTANDITLTVNLGTAGTGTITTTAASIKTLLEANANSSALATVSIEGVGSGVIAAAASSSVTSGAKDAFLTFQSKDFGKSQFVGLNVLQGAFTSTKTSVGGAATGRIEGTDVAARINGQVAQGKGLKATLTTSQLDVNLTFKSANNTASTNSKITVTGGGALFQIGQEVSAAGQIGLGIDAVNTARLGGLDGNLFELGSGAGKSLLDVGPTTTGSTLVSIVEDSISSVAKLRGRLGALQKNIIDTNISSLGVALENVSQARSQIIDTDFAAQTSELTRSQILSQAGLSVLSIANQNPSQVLSLLG